MNALKQNMMKTHRSAPRLQPLTPDAMVFIQTLAAEHNVGHDKRCTRYRRRADFRRLTVAFSIVTLLAFGTGTALAKPPLYTEIESCGSIDKAYICDVVHSMLNKEL